MPEFRKSRRCHSGGCAEVAADGETVLLRNSTEVDAAGRHVGPVAEFPADAWEAFVKGAAAGEFADLHREGTRHSV